MKSSLKLEKLKDEIKTLHESVKRLNSLFPKKKFTLDGRLVGDLGEMVAEIIYDIEVYDKIVHYYDAECNDGRRIQIKTTFKQHLTFNHNPDYFLGLKFFPNGDFEEVYNGPSNNIYEYYKHRKGIGTNLLSFPVSILKNLSESIPKEERIPKR